MTGRRGKLKSPPRNTSRFNQTILARSALVVGVVLVSGLIGSAPSWGQSNGPVSVDLSVLNDGGIRNSAGLPAFTGNRQLLVPPAKLPVSRLHVAPSTAPKLVRPAAAPKATPRVVTPAAPVMPAKVAKTAPKALKTPAPQPAPAPAPAAKVVKIDSPAPSAPPAPPAPKAASEAPKVATNTITKTAEAPPPAPAPPAPKKSEAPPPPPKVTEAPKPAAAPKSVAATDARIDLKPGRAARIEFGETATKIPGDRKDFIRSLAEGVRDKSDLRLQLMAFAGADGLSASKARRMSLSRALSVRSFLIENGVRSTRIDVRALGNKTSEKPQNRVDINIAKR
jgi:outer membrane protein OmpA-like peptidoglycan-associated protein